MIRRIVVLVALLAGAVTIAATPAAARLQRVVNNNDTLVMPGHVHPLARPEFDVGATDPSLPMEKMILTLRRSPEKQARLDQLLGELHNPTSPNFHRWLTPEEFGRQFGPDPEDIAVVTDWLGSQGFVVEEVGKGRTWINFSGKVSHVERAFRTRMRNYLVEGHVRHANDRDPAIPRGLADLVAGVVSLHNFPLKAMNSGVRPLARDVAQPEYTAGSSHYMSPGDFAVIYNVNPLYNAGINGSGTTIAIAGRTNPSSSNWATFRAAMGLSANAPQVIVNGADPGDLGALEDGEADLDVEWSGVVARNATIKFVTSKSTTSSDGVYLSAQYIVQNNLADVMSVSFGACEAQLGSANSFYNTLWQQAAALGITVFVSSGDSGGAGCDAHDASSGTVRAVNGMASTPYSVAVGGTQFNEGGGSYWNATNGAGDTSAISYIPEVAWNESGTVSGGTGLWATGGGVSSIYSKPSWQASPGVPADGKRDVPDVSLSAAGHDGYLVQTQGALMAMSGTSASSPAFAGLMALIVQHTGQRQGNANPRFYQLANAQYGSGGPAVFHDTTSGNNSVPGVTGYSSAAGYDLATGLGSVDAKALVYNWAPDFTLSSSPTSISAFQGASATTIISTAVYGGFSNVVSLSATGLPPGATATFSAPSIGAPGSGTSTLSLAAGVTTPVGTYTVTITGSAGGETHTTTVSFMVKSNLPDTPTGVAATPGNAQATVVFAAPAYTGSSPITSYTVTSNPGNITVTGTASPITVTGLTNGIPYTFTVAATNAYGTGPVSAPSPPVTPYTLPGAPTNVAAATGDAKVMVSFSLPADNGGATITSYKVTSSPGNVTATGTASPITVTGLTNGTTYTFTVTATNAAGTGPASSPSDAVIPCAVPGAPTNVTAIPGNNQAVVTFTAPATGGSPIISYTVISTPGNVTATGTTTTIPVFGLANGTAYTFVVTARNTAGTGSASTPSSSVTPFTGPTDFIWTNCFSTAVNVLAVDPTDSQTIYAGTGVGVYKTSNSCASWSTVSNGLATSYSKNIKSFAIDPANHQTAYAGTSGGLYKTTDGGASWNIVGNDSREVVSLAIDPSTPQTVYAVNSGGVNKTMNGGTSWSAVNSGLLGYNIYVNLLAIDPLNPQNIYAGTTNGLYATNNGGTYWSVFNGVPKSSVYSLNINPTNTQTLYFWEGYGIQNYGMFKTTNGGGSWSIANTGLPTNVDTVVRSMATNPNNPDTVFAASSHGVFKTVDGGGSWNPLGNMTFSVLAIAPAPDPILYAGRSDGVYKGSKANHLTVFWAGNGSGIVTSDRGAVSPVGASGTISYPVSTAAILTPTAGTGSSFVGWTGCDSTSGTYCTVTMNSDRNVAAIFTLNTYTVTPSPGPGGSISPASPQTVTYGTTTSFTITPNPGFVVSTVTGCGGTLSGTTYTTAAISADCTVQATFVPSVTGIVIDLSTGRPVTAATVTITGGATTQTDPSGYFKFSPQPSYGVYSVTIGKAGYSSVTITGVTVSTTSGGVVRTGLVPTTSAPLNITTSRVLPPATTGAAYSRPVTITGGTGPYAFNLAYGTLPPGLSLDGAFGTMSGTPTTAGSFTFAVGVTDNLGVYAEREFTVDVTGPLTITTTALPRGMATVTYAAAVVAGGGKPPYYFSLFSGVLPTGLALDGATGALQGKITATTGSYGLAVKVTDSEGRSTAQPYTLAVDPLLGQTTTRLADAITGAAYSQTLAATGGLGPYTWGIYAGTLQAGLSLDPATGIISGTPTVAAGASLSISVTDSVGRTAYQQYNLNVFYPLQIPTTTLPNGFVGAAYSELVRATGGTAPYSYSISGQLPAGLSITNATGIVSGTPTTGGYTNVSITITDSTWPTPQTQTVTMGIRIWSQLTVTSTSIFPNARKGVAITPLTMVARGGTTPYVWSVVNGYLPAGITLDPASGIVSGTPVDVGDFTFTIRATDNSATPATADKKFYLHVSDTLRVVTGAIPTGAVGVQYSASLRAVGGLKNYTWLVRTGTLPAGLSLDAMSGIVSGTPTAKLTSSVTFEVDDSDTPPQAAQQPLIFEIDDTLAISEPSLPIGRQGEAYAANVRPLLGTPPYTWQVTAGSLPPGLTLQQNAGIASLQGSPTTPGTYTFTLGVSDSGGPVQNATRQFTITIYGPMAITTTALRNAMRGVAYGDSVAAAGGSAPYSYQIVSGSLPQGLVFNSTTGQISGTTNVSTGFTSTFTVRATDSGVPAVYVEKQFTIQAIDPMAITTTAIPAALQGSPFSITFSGQGGISPRSWSIASGGLPTGILDGSTGVMSGTPTSCGSFPFTIQLADSSTVPATVQAGFTLTVTCSGGAPYPLSVTLAGTGNGSVNSSPSGLSCTGGTCSANFTSGTTVSLFQTEASGSVFAGWSGACSATGTCSVIMTAARNVTATFNFAPSPHIRLLGSSQQFATLQQAYDAAPDGAVIQLEGVTFIEDLLPDASKFMTIKGGYDSAFTGQTGMSTLQGVLSLGRGSFAVDHLIVR
jgi:subtilase family serine protease